MRTASSPILIAALAAACSSSRQSTPPAVEPTPAPAADAERPAPTEEIEAKPEPVELTGETDLESPSGAAFTAPEGWFVIRGDRVLELQPPERDLSIWMVDVEGQSAEDAIATAWKRVDPDFALEPDDRVAPPPQAGWDEIRQITYEVPVEDGRAAVGIGRRKGDTTYVVLLDGPVAALQRRGAQLGQIIGSQKPAGLDEESFADAEASALDDERAAELNAFIEEARTALNVPGAAIAIVQGDDVIFERAYGVRGPKGAKVTTNTRFMIGSTTKSLTSLMLAVLIDRGQFDWATPVTELLPGFALGDPDVTEKVQMQHTMCACTGLPRQDMEFLFEFDELTPERRIGELATMKPTTGFGETFQYSNALVSAGGFAAARAAAPDDGLMQAYARTMKRTVLGPLGMKATTFRTREARRRDHARPHGRALDGSYEAIPLSYEDAVLSVAPAGGAWSTVEDLARYVQLELREGELPDGERLLSEQELLERREPRVQIDDESFYGLALTIDHARDLTRIGHGGNTLGFTAHMVFFPEHDLGLVLLANAQGANGFTGAVERKLIELVLGGRDEAAEDLAFTAGRVKEVAEKEMAKITAPPEADWVDPILGEYDNDALGGLAITREDDHVMVDAGEWKVRAAAYESAGSKTLALVGPPLAGLTFIPEEDGSLLLDVGQQKYVFRPLEGGQ